MIDRSVFVQLQNCSVANFDWWCCHRPRPIPSFSQCSTETLRNKSTLRKSRFIVTSSMDTKNHQNKLVNRSDPNISPISLTNSRTNHQKQQSQTNKKQYNSNNNSNFPQNYIIPSAFLQKKKLNTDRQKILQSKLNTQFSTLDDRLSNLRSSLQTSRLSTYHQSQINRIVENNNDLAKKMKAQIHINKDYRMFNQKTQQRKPTQLQNTKHYVNFNYLPSNQNKHLPNTPPSSIFKNQIAINKPVVNNNSLIFSPIPQRIPMTPPNKNRSAPNFIQNSAKQKSFSPLSKQIPNIQALKKQIYSNPFVFMFKNTPLRQRIAQIQQNKEIIPMTAHNKQSIRIGTITEVQDTTQMSKITYQTFRQSN